MEQVNDCRNCKHHQEQPRAKPTGWQHKAHFELADDTQVSFRCGAPVGPYAGTEVGLVPVTCPSHEPGTATPLDAPVQTAYDLWVARMAKREDK